MVDFIKKFLDMDEDYALLKWSLHFDTKANVTFSGELVPKYRKND